MAMAEEEASEKASCGIDAVSIHLCHGWICR